MTEGLGRKVFVVQTGVGCAELFVARTGDPEVRNITEVGRWVYSGGYSIKAMIVTVMVDSGGE